MNGEYRASSVLTGHRLTLHVHMDAYGEGNNYNCGMNE
jgi:hypothetical protein